MAAKKCKHRAIFTTSYISVNSSLVHPSEKTSFNRGEKQCLSKSMDHSRFYYSAVSSLFFLARAVHRYNRHHRYNRPLAWQIYHCCQAQAAWHSKQLSRPRARHRGRDEPPFCPISHWDRIETSCIRIAPSIPIAILSTAS